MMNSTQMEARMILLTKHDEVLRDRQTHLSDRYYFAGVLGRAAEYLKATKDTLQDQPISCL